MNIPEKLKIIGKTYDVQMGATIATDEGYVCLGRHRGGLNSIQINPGYPQQTQDSTLLHEILEAINNNFEMELKHSQITTLEETLYQVLKDNKLHFDE